MFEYYQISFISDSPKYDNLLKKTEIGLQLSYHNLNDANIKVQDMQISKNEILDVFIELLDDWVDLELSGFTKDDNNINFNEHVEHAMGYKIYPLYTKIDTDISLD